MEATVLAQARSYFSGRQKILNRRLQVEVLQAFRFLLQWLIIINSLKLLILGSCLTMSPAFTHWILLRF